MKWTIYQFMGDWNPVCEDAGDMEIVLSPDQSPYFRVDGILFSPSDNPSIQRWGFTCFDPFEDSFDYDLHERKKVIRKGIVVIDMSKGGTPITTDPRVLMVMHYFFHNNWKVLKKVPTRLEAVKYLLKEKALYPLVSRNIPAEQCEPLSLDDLAAQGLTPETV